MGFPHEYLKHFDPGSDRVQPFSDTQAYRQFGNAVVVPVVSAVARLMQPHLETALERAGRKMPPRQEILPLPEVATG